MELLEKVNLLLFLDYRVASTLFIKIITKYTVSQGRELLWCHNMHPAL